MTIYYFMKQRFPRKEKRAELRAIFAKEGGTPEHVLNSDDFFTTFKLKLPTLDNGNKNKFHGLQYKTLEEHKSQFELRTIRNIIVKQNTPTEDDSSMYEIFNRLNTGGVNLKPQEIRTSMYHSLFYEMLERINMNPTWRNQLSMDAPALHMKDQEILLRGFAFYLKGEEYKPSLTRFLNTFSKTSKTFDKDTIFKLEQLAINFFTHISHHGPLLFTSKITKKFNVALFESIFSAACEFKLQNGAFPQLSPATISSLESDNDFSSALQEGTTKTENVKKRLNAARRIINANY